MIGLDNLKPAQGSKHRKKIVGRGVGSGHGRETDRKEWVLKADRCLFLGGFPREVLTIVGSAKNMKLSTLMI